MKSYSFGQWVLNHRGIGFFICAAILALSVYGARYFSFDATAESNFDVNSPIFIENEKLNSVFSSSDTIIFDVSFADTVFSNESYERIRSISESLELVPGVTQVSSLSSIAIPSNGEDGEMSVGFLADKFDLNSSDGLRKMHDYVYSSNLTKDIIVTRDGKSSAIYATVLLPSGPERAKAQQVIYDSLRLLRDDHIKQCGGSCTIEFNGKLVEEKEITGTAVAAMPISVIVQNLVLFFSLLAITSSARSALFVCLISTFGSVVSVGLVALFGYRFNSLSISSGPIICSILFSQSIHLVWQYLNKLSLGMPSKDAIAEAIDIVAIPTIATTAITLVSYLSISNSPSPSMFTYGISLAVGGVCGLLFIFFILPHCLCLIKEKPKYLITQFIRLDLLADFLVSRPRSLVISFGIPMLILAGLAFKNIISEYPRGMLDKGNAYRNSAEKIDSDFGGSSSVSYILYAPEGRTIEDAEFISAASSFTSWCREQPSVSSVSSITDVVHEINSALHGDDVRENRKLTGDDISDGLFLYHLSLPYGSDTNESISADKKMIKIHVSFYDSRTHVLLDFVDKANSTLDGLGISGSPTGLSYIFARFMVDFAKQEISSFVGLIFGVFLFMLFWCRSLLIASVISLPLAIPVMAGLGVSYLTGGTISLMVCSAIGITVGLVVDEAMHLVAGFFERIKAGVSAEDSAAYSIIAAGPGIIISSLVLAAGFISVSFSEWANYWHLAKVFSIIIAISVVFQFFVLMPALILFNQKK